MAQSEPSPADAALPSQDELKDIMAKANQQYAMKSYGTAADIYSQATALQAELNGEMAPQNAELLYFYGRCLFHVGVSKSDVLGSKVAGDGRTANVKNGKKRKRGGATNERNAATKEAEKVAEGIENKDTMKSTKDEGHTKEEGKPFFQITGDDEDWEDESDSNTNDDADSADEEQDDDLATAYEILDTARVLFARQIEDVDYSGKSKDKGKVDDGNTDGLATRKAKELLADTHDLQAEISLENERFADAVTDSRASLSLKQELFPEHLGVVAEAHFKLSLALEFASVTVQADGEKLANPEKELQVDEELRKEAATEMESAIECTKLRLKKGIESLATLDGQELNDRTKEMDDIKEIISDMEQRLEDLRNPAVTTDSSLGSGGAVDDANPLGGILGSLLGESPAAQRARIEQASEGANDLSGIVRRQKPKAQSPPELKESMPMNGHSKRKAEENGQDVGNTAGKRAKTEEAGP